MPGYLCGQGDVIMVWSSRFAARVTAVGCALAIGGLAAIALAPGAAFGRPWKPAPRASAAPAVVGKDPHKGVAVWTFNGVNRALSKSGASWYYTWAPGHLGITTPSGSSFVPMIWGASSVTKANLAEVKRE